ncbi:hypothetical protein BIW11_05179 [Tropilaelaps mercedesae]|uniref:Uncharacterized protein n=1 Tax=Tropilaelaps mercedesae TaxID=418985 RepID=A0A1V9Y3K2_9ACAR|nr:hypothetical protein BIW11_05179 [Tropilaelaps mercedesae]
MNDQGEEDKWANKSHKDRVSLIEPHMESGAKAPEFVPNKPSSFVTQARIRERKFNFETIAEQRAELEEFRYKLDMFESRLRNSSFMDPEQRGILHELAKEAREHLKKLEPKVNHIHRSSQKSLVTGTPIIRWRSKCNRVSRIQLHI